MGDLPSRTGTPSATPDTEGTALFDPPGPPKSQYVPYRPPNADFTPPASPKPMSPYAQPSGRKGFSASRSRSSSRQPVKLHMDTNVTPLAYERPVYSPSPSSSPPLPPLPSPKFALQPRQRAPSLLRHAALSSPLNTGYPRAEHSTGSPTFGPLMMRQGSGQGPTSDPRSIFNALGSNPVISHSPTSELLHDDRDTPQQRMRGMTSSSQPSPYQQYHPPLRSATSIPDYGPIRKGERVNLSGAYRPNRGGPNWSHNDHYPPRLLRGEEPRASFRSGWTNASSSFVEQSGTERSSMATGRSSVLSDTPESTYSRDRSEERDPSIDTRPTSTTLEEQEEIMSTVEDVIDAYFEDDISQELSREDSDEVHDRSSEYSQENQENSPQEMYHAFGHPSQHMLVMNDGPMSEGILGETDKSTQPGIAITMVADAPGTDASDDDSLAADPNSHVSYLPPLAISPLKFDYSPTTPTPDKLDVQPQDYAWQRSSEEIPRPVSLSKRNSVLGMPKATKRLSKPPPRPRYTRKPSGNAHKLLEMHREISGLPHLPTKKSRLSEQDWNEIQAYTNRNTGGGATMPKPAVPESEPSASPPKAKVELPEVDEDEAVPRRASTSVYDRRSTLFNLGNFDATPPSKSKTTDFGNPLTPRAVGQPLRKALSGSERDRYGFKKANHNISLQEYDAWVGKYDEHVARRRNKWTALMTKQGLSTINPAQFPEPCDKVKRYARKGYPPEWRGAMWWFYSGGQQKIRQPEMAGLYASLVARIERGELNKDDREAIERDLDRTFPDNVHFRPDPTAEDPEGTLGGEPLLIQDLREVLQCFALNNPNIGYCQSLNFIAGLLLLFLKQDKERAFILLTIITQNHLPGAHARSLANTEVNVLMMLIRDYLPKVWNSINDTDLVNSGPGSKAHPDSKFSRQPTVALSCTSWFMSIFVGVLPIETVLRVWDAFLYEGPRALYRYALAIFKLGEGEIRKYRPGDGELFMAVQNLPRRCLNPNILHDIAFVKKGFGSLTQSVIDQKRMFWREQNERAKRSASGKAKPQHLTADVAEDESRAGMGGGLKRKASRRFLKKKNTGL